MSLSTFTENIMILAVENCLIRKIPDMFASTMITSMNDDMLARLASETRKVREERETLQQDLGVLDSGLRECKRYRPPRELTGKYRPKYIDFYVRAPTKDAFMVVGSRPSRSSTTRLSSSTNNRAVNTNSQSSNPPRTPTRGVESFPAIRPPKTPNTSKSSSSEGSNSSSTNASGSGSSLLSPGMSQHTRTSSAASSVSANPFAKALRSPNGNGSFRSQHCRFFLFPFPSLDVDPNSCHFPLF